MRASMYQCTIPLTPPRLIKLVKALGGCWVRVSGSWAIRTYYDFADEYPAGTAPKGCRSVLKKHHWINLLNFFKAVGGKLKISVANCDSFRVAHESWNLRQAELIFALSKEHGVPVRPSKQESDTPDAKPEVSFYTNF